MLSQPRQLRQAHRTVPPALDARALVDTGAEITCVDGTLIQQPLAQPALANIPALGGLRVATHYHASVVVARPSGPPLVVPNILILEAPLASLGYQALIGRDLLARCDFIYSGRRQRFALRY
jgi:hypothetical protein